MQTKDRLQDYFLPSTYVVERLPSYGFEMQPFSGQVSIKNKVSITFYHYHVRFLSRSGLNGCQTRACAHGDLCKQMCELKSRCD